MASHFPSVRFIVAGGAQDPAYEREIEGRSRDLVNLERRGFVNQFESDELSRILAESWILINTSAREGLPNSFIEACAHRCAVLSPVDPDGFASRFGAHVPDGDFASGLERLLAGDGWRALGAAGHAYVRDTNDAPVATERHLALYRKLLGSPAS